MLEKIGKIFGKLNSTVLLAIGLGIVVLAFIIGLVLAVGGDLARFKKAAKLAISNPTPGTLNESAKKMPIYVRKLYKKAKQSGEKPSDVIGINACVHEPFAASSAAKFPGAVMTAGILAILFSFFAVWYAKDGAKIGSYYYILPLLVTVVTMVLRLLAGIIAGSIHKSAVGVYNKYVDMLDKNLHGGASAVHVSEAEAPIVEEPVVQEPALEAEEPEDEPVMEMAVQEDEQAEVQTPVKPASEYNTFDAPERITVELADEEMTQERVQTETVIVQSSGESEEETRARARAEALAAARAEAAARAQAAAAEQEKAQADAVAKAQADAVARAQAAARAAQAAQAAQSAQTASSGASSADAVIARIEKINQEGGTLAEMKDAALQLQKERAKPENKTPEMQRKLNEALATLLKAMSGASKK